MDTVRLGHRCVHIAHYLHQQHVESLGEQAPIPPKLHNVMKRSVDFHIKKVHPAGGKYEQDSAEEEHLMLLLGQVVQVLELCEASFRSQS